MLTRKSIEKLKVPEGKSQVIAWDERLPGFGVVKGATKTSYIVNYRDPEGTMRRKVLGVFPEMSVDDARDAAALIVHAKPEARPVPSFGSGPTLRAALEFHVGKMERGENRRGKACSPRSIATLRGCVELHLAAYLDRPLVEVTADVLDEVRLGIEREAERIEGSNEKNPPGRAVGNRLLACVSAIWRSYHKRHGLDAANPAERLIKGALVARENRIPDAQIKAWHETVLAMPNHVRRDLQLVALFTGVRTDGIRQIRWDDVDFDDDQIRILRAKGDKPYVIPMVSTVRKILLARKDENASIDEHGFGVHGGDAGFVFPSLSRDQRSVKAVAEVKERRPVRDAEGRAQRDEDGNYVRERYLPGIQACRKTFNSVAEEIGIPVERRNALMNHEGHGVNVRHYTFPESVDYWADLAKCATKIESALWERIKSDPAKRRRGKLHAV